jgi:hypothetical protein
MVLATDMPGHLNIFQRAMLRWNDLQPYNAVHLLRLAGRLEPDRLRQVIESSLVRRGVACLTLNRRHGTYAYQPGVAPIMIRAPGDGRRAEPELTAQIERELNTPFQIDAPFCPVRFFLLPDPNGFVLGATYFHPVADAESMILLLRGIVADYLGAGDAYPSHPFNCHPPRHDRLWHFRPTLILRKLLALPAELWRTRHFIRMRLLDADDLRNRVRLLHVGGETVEALVGTARRWGVTVHDLLLALFLQALAPLAPRRTGKSRRRNLALGSIVNVRGECGIDRDRTFGLFLGSFVVNHPVPEGIDLHVLATDLRRQTGVIKRHKLFLATPLELAFAGRIFNLYSTRRQKQFYHKYHPLAGGISNMSLDRYWQPGDVARPAEYFRAVSTGPTTPLVLSTSTYNHGMTLALSYRTGVFTPAAIDELLGRLSAALKGLEDAR